MKQITQKCCQEVVPRRRADLQGAGELVDLALQVASVSLSAVQLLQALLQRLTSCLQLTLHRHHTSLSPPQDDSNQYQFDDF